MYYFFCSLSYWGPDSKEAARVLTGQGSQDFNSVNNLRSSYQKSSVSRRLISIQPHVPANKALSGYLLISQLVRLP